MPSFARKFTIFSNVCLHAFSLLSLMIGIAAKVGIIFSTLLKLYMHITTFHIILQLRNLTSTEWIQLVGYQFLSSRIQLSVYNEFIFQLVI